MTRKEQEAMSHQICKQAAEMADTIAGGIGYEVVAQWGCLIYQGLVQIHNTTKDKESQRVAAMFLENGQMLLEAAAQMKMAELQPAGHA